MSYENIWEKNGVYRKYKSGINGKELIQAAEDVLGHELFDSISYVINDLLTVTEHDVKASDIFTLSEMDRAAVQINPNVKIAIVTTTLTVQLLASLYDDLMSHSPYPIKIFENLHEARSWVS